jgi:processive 1,2-diacylglycerol beta-glucosyltransferase
VRAIVRETLALPMPLALLAAVGRNRALATALADLHSTDRATLHVLGPQPSLDPLIAASDIVVGKPGGLTVSEVMARGVPLLLVMPAPGQEHANARYVEHIGAGQCHTTAAGMTQAVAALLQDEPQRKAMAAAAKYAGRPAAAHSIAAHVLGDVERGNMFHWPHAEATESARTLQ